LADRIIAGLSLKSGFREGVPSSCPSVLYLRLIGSGSKINSIRTPASRDKINKAQKGSRELKGVNRKSKKAVNAAFIYRMKIIL
jgi:hypothetical protein